MGRSSALKIIKMKTLIAIAFSLALIAICLAEDVEYCPQEVSDKCPIKDPVDPVYFANPDDCKSYCECSNHHAYKLLCGPQTVWDDTNKRCDWAQNVDRGSRPNN